jgi:hypothetical protein
MYYVYHYIDPRTMLPFYVGKGKDNRCYDHLTESEDTTENRHKFYKIQYLVTNNTPPIIKKIIENITDEQVAYDLEEKEILKYGRIGFEENGILTNICLGNTPPNPKGKVRSVEHCKALSIANTGKKKAPEAIQKTLDTKRKNGTLVSGMKGKKHNESTKSKIRQRKAGNKMSSESSDKKSKALTGRPWSEARRAAALTQRKSGPKSNE